MLALRPLLASLLVTFVLALGALGASGARSAGPFGPADEVACTFDPQTHVAQIDYGVSGESDQAPIVWISRVGDAIRIEEDFPGPGPNVECTGGSPTVQNTDRLELAAVTKLRTSETYITVGDTGLAPGATPERGGDEIEITTDLGRSAQVHVNGGRGPDHWAFGSRDDDTHVVNLNAGEGHPDADLVVAPTPRSLSGNVGDGSDRATAMGGAGTGTPLRTDLLLIGLGGNQRFVGGPGDDELLGYFGNDVLIGGRGDDRLDIVGGKGHDVLICGPGHDEYRSSPKDKVRC
jgi:hypothetical protein